MNLRARDAVDRYFRRMLIPVNAMPETPTRAESRFNAAARLVLAFMLFAAPVPFGAVLPWAWASLSVLTALLLILWVTGRMRHGTLSIAYSPLLIPFGLLLALGCAQWIFRLTFDPTATRESVVKLATDLSLFFVVIQLFAAASRETWQRYAMAVLAYGFVLSFFSVLQFLWNPARILWVGHNLGGPFGPYVDRDHYAGLMEMIVPVAACFVLSRPKRDPRQAILWCAVLVSVVSLLLTGSRGGIVSLFVETALLGGIMIRWNPQVGRQGRVVAGLALMTGAALFFWLAPTFILNKLGTMHNYASEVRTGRVALWKDSLRLWRDHLWLGVGMGSFATVYPRYQTEPSELVTEHAHNDYLEALTETGLMGGVLMLAALATFLLSAFGNLRLRLQSDVGWIQLGTAIACCGLLVHSFVDFNLRIPANGVWFAFCAGLAVAADGTHAYAQQP